jgi:hypothetical protein
MTVLAIAFQFLRDENTRRNFFSTHGKFHSDVINSKAGKKAWRQAALDQSLPRSQHYKQSKIDKTANYFTETQFIKGINIYFKFKHIYNIYTH